MYKTRTKIIASMLVLMLTMTHLSILGEVIASSLENQTQATNHANVEFDSYFMEENKKLHSASKTIAEENQLYFSIKVKEAGYLKEASVEIENANFKMVEPQEESTAIAKVESNKIAFNRIKSESEVEVAVPIQMLQTNTILPEELSKENKISFHAIYVDGNGNEKKIEKEIKVQLTWEAEKEVNLNMQIAKFIPYSINGQKGLILQTLLQSSMQENTMPVKENKIEMVVPTINGIKPQEVKVVANSTKATNGDETGIYFTEENYNYSMATNTLTILTKNEANEEGKVSWEKGAQDELVVTCIYSEEALNSISEEGVLVSIEANNEITTYGVTETKVEKAFTGEVTLKEQISSLVDFALETNVTELSKGQIYANEQASNKIETEYQETIKATIGLAQLTDKVVIEKQADNFQTEQNTALTLANGSYYKTLSMDKENFTKMLGEEGSVTLYVGTTEIAKIDKDTVANEQGKFELDLASMNISSFRIETSKPQTEGALNFALTKAIKGEIGYSKVQLKNANKLQLSLTGTAMSGETKFVEQAVEKEIALLEPVSQAELVMSNNNLSTVVTNENVKITAILKTDTMQCNLYKNPTLQITLPSYIEEINIKNIEVLFDTEGSKLTLASHQVLVNADGSKTIVIALEGTQTEYTLGAVSKGVNIVITTDIIVNKLMPNKQDQIKMAYTNQNVITLARTAMQETGEVVTPVNIVAPVGVITTSTIQNYAPDAPTLTAMSGEEKTGILPRNAEAQNATFEMNVINNYNNTIDNISILGRTAFKGNKNIETLADLGTTMNMPLTSNIAVTGVEASKVAVYYSENENATKELATTSNGWTQTPANLANVKSYLIVFTDTSMNTGDNIKFSYTAQIPANLAYNESAYENYVVYFNNNLETGMLQDKEVSTKLGVTTGRGPVLEASIVSDKSETEEVLTGNMIKYTLTVKNTGTEAAQNVIANVELPIGLQQVELQEGSYLPSVLQGKVELGTIAANQTVTKEIYTRVGILTEDTQDAELKATITATEIPEGIETQVVKNKLATTHFILTPTVLKETDTLKENDTYTYYLEVISSRIDQTRQNTVLTINIPEEIEYQSVDIEERVDTIVNDIKANTTYNYDSKTRTLTIQLGEVNGENAKMISLHVKVNTLPENVYDREVNIDAVVSAQGARTQKANIDSVQIAKIGFKVTQTSNIPENSHITAGEDLKYIFTIENLSNMDLYNVKVTDILPEGLSLNNMTLTRETESSVTSYKDSINFSLHGKEKVTLEVNVTVDILEETRTVANKAKIECEGMETIETSSYTHIIDKFDEANYDDPSNDPENPNSQTKRIMGTVWLDQNANGEREENESKVANVDMLLFNNQTGNLVTDSQGNVLRTKTDENGTYTFARIPRGKYTVIFLYDTANYSATTYRKENVNSALNSDAVDSKITLDGVTRVAAITEEVAVAENNMYNIDLGLVENPKFDLTLEKTVSKITVQDGTGTNVYEYTDSKLAKRDLVGKQINNTTILVEYKLKVTNEGAISGYAKKIADYMPSEMKFNSELNKDWYTSEDGVLYNASLANTLINPGESKEVTLLLTKKMTENNVGLYHNEAEIYEAYNDLGIQDVDSTPGNKVSNEDDLSSADVLISVKTGETILFVGLSITIITIIGSGAYIIKKKVIR